MDAERTRTLQRERAARLRERQRGLRSAFVAVLLCGGCTFAEAEAFATNAMRGDNWRKLRTVMEMYGWDYDAGKFMHRGE